MKLTLVINGREDHIELLSPAPACRFRLGNSEAVERQASVESPQSGVYSVLLDGRSYDAYVEETPAGLADVAALVAALHTARRKPAAEPAACQPASRWLETGRSELLR